MYEKFFFEKNIIYSAGFEADHEITIKLLKNKFNIIELPINYYPRTRQEGKKISGKKIKRIVQYGRSTYYCPEIQFLSKWEVSKMVSE